jgi:hypothetical protein
LQRKLLIDIQTRAEKWYSKNSDRQVGGTTVADRIADDETYRIQCFQYKGTPIYDMARDAILHARKHRSRDEIYDLIEGYCRRLLNKKEATQENAEKQACIKIANKRNGTQVQSGIITKSTSREALLPRLHRHQVDHLVPWEQQ